MAGHNKWSKIKRQKGAEDAKRGAIFTKLGNQIAIAAKGGADPDMNPSLAMAIDKAKQANMPKANIERSIARATDKDAAQLEEVIYEGYGPAGVGIIVECATDNTNRTYPEVKLAFSKNGGNIAEKGAVAFQFERKGVIRVKQTGDELMMAALEAGAEDIKEDDGESIIFTEDKQLASVRDKLKEAGIKIEDAELSFEAKNTVEITDETKAKKVMKLMDALEDLDDVSNTHVNFDIDESLLDV